MTALVGGSNLPADVTSFVGRSAELVRGTELLETTRLLTLTGAGGCGKTRLALELARRVALGYEDGTWWADLGPVNDGDMVPNSVAAALGIQEVPLLPWPQRMQHALRDKNLLLIIDNCEHLLGPVVDLIAPLLHGCPRVSVLATSREALGLDGETAWKVPSLEIAAPNEGLEAVSNSDAVALFVDRALKSRPNFRLDEANAPVIAEICARLDGIPLAIELAAARIRLMNPNEIARALDDRFRLLSGGARTAVARQQTLLASVEWSYQLLASMERTLLQRLAVFSGSFSLDAAESVCGDDDVIPPHLIFDSLSSLVDKSLVQVDHGVTSTRYKLLETIRQFASQKLLESDEAPSIRDRHLNFFHDYSASFQQALEGGPNSGELLTTIDRDYENLRAALEWARSSMPTLGARMARSLWTYWWAKGLLGEGSRLAETAAEDDASDPSCRSRALAVAAALATTGMDGVRARILGEQAFVLANSVEDGSTDVEILYAKAASSFFTEPLVARPLLEEALSKLSEARKGFWPIRCIFGLGIVAVTSGELGVARRHFEEALRLHRDSGDRLLSSWIVYWLVLASTWAGKFDEIEEVAHEALESSKELGNAALECGTWLAIGLAAVLQGNTDDATELLRKARRLSDAHPDPVLRAGVGLCEGMHYYLTGGRAGSCEGLDDSLAFCDAGGISWFGAQVVAVKSGIARAGGDLGEATRCAQGAIKRARESRNINSQAIALRAEANLALAEGDFEKAADRHHEALRLFHDAEANVGVLDSLDSIACLAAQEESWEEAARILGGADRWRHELQLHRYEIDLPGFQEHSDHVHTILASRWSDLFAEGAALSLDQLVAYATRGRGERKRPSSGWKSLTPTEGDVVRLVAEGLTNAEIGQRLFIASGTVKNHLSHIFAKLGVSTRAELAAEAARRSAREPS